jgi:hypothetical protein
MSDLEIDEAIARDACGWTKYPMVNGVDMGYRRNARFSKVLEDALYVVGRMAIRKRPWMVTIKNWNYNGERYWTVMFRDSSIVNVEVQAQDYELPRAICVAALLAVAKELEVAS